MIKRLITWLFGIHFHSFGKWELIGGGTLNYQGTDSVAGHWTMQKRICTGCGLVKIKKTELY